MPTIHPTAHVDPACVLADDVVIGPYCVLTGRVTLGAGCRLLGNVYIQGPTTIGEGAVIYPFACVGFEGQDVKFKPGSPTPGVVIGKNAILREHATIHAATKPDKPTTVGDNAFLLVNAHIGHDCVVGHNVVMVNNSCLGGHVTMGDNCLLGGGAVIHQFVRVGRFAVFSGDCGSNLDVPPFCTCNERNRIGGINRVGLRRNGFPREHITALMETYREFLRVNYSNADRVAALRERGRTCPPLLEMAEFIEGSKRGIAPGIGKPPRGAASWIRELLRGNNQPDLEEELDEAL
jgi:UDP-N-acetylglucosamine acyltransferase